MRLLTAVLAGSLLCMPACVTGQPTGRYGADLPTPVPVRDILYAQPFTVETPFINPRNAEQARLSSGVFVVLEVDPAYVVPRNAVANPVLYAGGVPVIRLNDGHQSGRVIGIIPGSIDLVSAPIWFGSRQIPGGESAAIVQAESARAEKVGIRPFPAEKIAAVRRPPVRSTDLAALLRDVAAELVDRFSPQDKAYADRWRLPEAKAPYKRPN